MVSESGMSTRHLVIAAVAFLAGSCTGDIGGGKLLFGNLEVSPNLTDVGAQPVGVPHVLAMAVATVRMCGYRRQRAQHRRQLLLHGGRRARTGVNDDNPTDGSKTGIGSPVASLSRSTLSTSRFVRAITARRSR